MKGVVGMREKKQIIKLRNCYDKNGEIINDNMRLEEFRPLSELLAVIRSIQRAETSGFFEKAG